MESHRDQADLSAQQPPAGQDARLPTTHADPRRTGHHRCAPP